MTMELSTLSTRHFKASLIFALITALAACGGGGGGGGGDTGPSLEAPALENAPAQSYAQNVAIEALRLSNSGGGELTSCRATSLPAGLNVAVSSDGASCVISGTPSVISGQVAYTITATNATGSSSASVAMTVNLLAPVLVGVPLQSYFLDGIISPLRLTNRGGGDLTSCTADSLPTGLSVAVSSDGTTCVISGTPTVVAGEAAYTITATNDTASRAASVTITVNLLAPILAGAPLQAYFLGRAISPLSLANSGGGALTSCTADSLPKGLSVAVSSDDTTCVISGTPTVVSGEAVYAITATNDTASSGAFVTITVNLLAPALANVPLQSYFLGRAISPLRLTNNGGGDLTSCSVTSLPAGLNVGVSNDGTSCTITGTPTATSVETTYTITATNVTGSSTASIPMEVTQRPFISIWKTDNYGSSDNNQIAISMGGTASNYTVDWGDGSQDSEITEDITHTYSSVGTYTVTIRGDFPQIVSCQDDDKLLSVEQWGDIQWQSMAEAFSGCTKLVINAPDVPNLSQVTDMRSMFRGVSAFNQDIGGWDVSAVTDMSYMFYGVSDFNQDLSGWDVSAVTGMRYMFAYASTFNQDISGWDVSAVADMRSMFREASTFNQDISGWDVSAVTDMRSMFAYAYAFNQDLSGWDVSAVTDMRSMFYYASDFNQDISGWNVSEVTDMSSMFAGVSTFNQDIGRWDVSAVTDMAFMFYSTRAFNRDLSGWNVSAVINMSSMFRLASAFNQDLSSWDVSAVTSMAYMFGGARAFNQDLSGWDVSAVTSMSFMFSGASAFNQGLSGWDVSAVTSMAYMFVRASAFNQDIGAWDISSVTDMTEMFSKVTLSTANYDALLTGWSVQSVQSGVNFDGGNSMYSPTSQSARDTLTGAFNWWYIIDGGVEPVL